MDAASIDAAFLVRDLLAEADTLLRTKLTERTGTSDTESDGIRG